MPIMDQRLKEEIKACERDPMGTNANKCNQYVTLHPLGKESFLKISEKCMIRHQDDEEREKEETGVLPKSVLQGLEPRHNGRLQQVA